jgi:hypothetical protein
VWLEARSQVWSKSKLKQYIIELLAVMSGTGEKCGEALPLLGG